MNKSDQSVIFSTQIHQSDLFNFNFFNGSKNTLIDLYISRIIKNDQLKKSTPTLIFTPNPEQIVLSKNQPTFAAALREADILIPDGMGLIWASRLLNILGKTTQITERITGVDLLQDILTRFSEEKIVLIGGKSDQGYSTKERVFKNSFKDIPWLPAYDQVKHPTVEEEKQVALFLKKHKPSIVFVAFGAPFQEFWSIRHRELLRQHGVKLVLVVGGAVDVLAGRLHRAPIFIQKIGLEWLFRLIQEPWRWKRQLRLTKFIGLTIRELQ